MKGASSLAAGGLLVDFGLLPRLGGVSALDLLGSEFCSIVVEISMNVYCYVVQRKKRKERVRLYVVSALPFGYRLCYPWKVPAPGVHFRCVPVYSL